MGEYILELDGVTFQYPDGTLALREISLQIEKGSKVALLGPNGAGKSTLFLLLNGVLKPTQGRIFFKGKEVRYHHLFLKELRRSVGIVFQDPETQIFSANVFQEISFGPLNLGLPEKIVKQRVEKALETVGISELKNKATHFLSYGQKKRVAIADILAMEPEVIILDEPTASLDPKSSAQIMNFFSDLNKTGLTIILSTHDVDMAYSWADVAIILKEGKLVGAGKPAEIFTNDRLLQNSDLDRPFIVEVYHELRNSGYFSVELPVPKDKRELLDLIRRATKPV